MFTEIIYDRSSSTTSIDSTSYNDAMTWSTMAVPAENEELVTSTVIAMADIINESVSSSPYSPDIVIVLSVIIAVIIFITVVGNLLVVVSFLTTPKLRTYNNYFILGLAIADFVVGAVDMPLFAIIIITGKWPLGEVFCDIFTFLDHAFSHVSILLVTLISLDRCIAVTYPIRHRQYWRRRSRAILIIAISYLIPFVIWLPLTTLWEVIQGIEQRPIPEDECGPLYIESLVASIIIPIVYFLIPFTITAILCVRIYIVIKRFYKSRKGIKVTLTFEKSQPTIVGETSSDNGTRDTTISSRLSSSTISDTIDVGKEHDVDNKEAENQSGDQKRVKLRKESMKGVRTLVFIVIAMCLAWSPSVLVIITSSICPTCLPSVIYSVVVFWGYTNSLMNPICYSLADEDFKNSFIRILSLRCFKQERR